MTRRTEGWHARLASEHASTFEQMHMKRMLDEMGVPKLRNSFLRHLDRPTLEGPPLAPEVAWNRLEREYPTLAASMIGCLGGQQTPEMVALRLEVTPRTVRRRLRDALDFLLVWTGAPPEETVPYEVLALLFPSGPRSTLDDITQ